MWKFRYGSKCSTSPHPHGVEIFQLGDICQRDTLVATNPHFLGHREIRFFRHDEAPINIRRTIYTRKDWLMLLGYPLDLREAVVIKQVVAPFAQIDHWNDDRSLARILVKCIMQVPLKVPRSLVISVGHELDGEGRSWTVPVYMFDSEILGAAPANEEDLPENNGNPHPFHDLVALGEVELVQNLADQFIQNMAPAAQPMQLDPPDQASNAGSITQSDNSPRQAFSLGLDAATEVEVTAVGHATGSQLPIAATSMEAV